MPKLNSRIDQRIKPSGTISLFNKVKQLRDSGADIVSFTAGELDIDSPQSAKDAAIKAINDNFTRYTFSDGTKELRQAVADDIKKQTGQTYALNQILITNGCKQASYNILMALLSEGDEVILPIPYYTSHIRQVEMLSGTPALVKTTLAENYQVTQPMLQKVCNSKTKVLLITSPQNPTGVVYDGDSLRAIAEFVIKNDLWLISDEIYSGIVYKPVKFEPILKLYPELKERLFIVNALSKSFAMTGWRVGYGAGPENVIKHTSNIQANTTSNVCSIAQMAALGALTKEPEFCKSFISDIQTKRDFAYELISKIDGIKCIKPDGAFYLFPNIESFIGKKHGSQVMNTTEDLAQYLLTEHKLAVVPGAAFGAPEHIRISFAASQELLEKGLKRLKDGLEQLN